MRLVVFVALLLGHDALTQAFDAAPLAVVAVTLLFIAGGVGLAWVMARRVDRLRVVFFIGVAINEELAFRGYQLNNLSEGFAGGRVGPRGAIILAFLASSLLFGTAHASNANATVWSTLAVVLSGLLIALPYLVTGQLAIPIGLHLTWNLFQGPVFGFPVSGNPPSMHLYSIEVTGPALWTGGAFGAEAGVMALVWAVVGCGLTLAWIRWRRGTVALHVPLATYTPWRPGEQHDEGRAPEASARALRGSGSVGEIHGVNVAYP